MYLKLFIALCDRLKKTKKMSINNVPVCFLTSTLCPTLSSLSSSDFLTWILRKGYRYAMKRCHARRTRHLTLAPSETLTTILDMLPDAVFLLDQNEQINYMNVQARCLAGATSV